MLPGGVEGSACVGSSLPAYTFLLRQIVCHRRAQAQPALAHTPRCYHTLLNTGTEGRSAPACAPGHDNARHNMVPQEPLLCRQLFCFITIIIVLPTQRAQLNSLTPLQCETHTGPYPAPRFSVLPLFCMRQEARIRFGHGTPQRLIPIDLQT
jgi:hypothetical protein